MPTQFSFIKNIPLSEPPFSQSLVTIPIASIPAVLGALENRARYAVWSSGNELNGVQIIRRFQMSILLPYAGIDNLYRLLDNALNGTIYSETSPGIVEPSIPVVPRGDYEVDYIRDELFRITAALEAAGASTEEDWSTLLNDLELLLALLA